MPLKHTNHPLHDKKVFFIGRFASCQRKEAVAKLEIAGGKYRDKLTPLVDIVVVGENPANTEGASIKEAQALQAAGKLSILRESEFLKLMLS